MTQELSQAEQEKDEDRLSSHFESAAAADEAFSHNNWTDEADEMMIIGLLMTTKFVSGCLWTRLGSTSSLDQQAWW